MDSPPIPYHPFTPLSGTSRCGSVENRWRQRQGDHTTASPMGCFRLRRRQGVCLNTGSPWCLYQSSGTCYTHTHTHKQTHKQTQTHRHTQTHTQCMHALMHHNFPTESQPHPPQPSDCAFQSILSPSPLLNQPHTHANTLRFNQPLSEGGRGLFEESIPAVFDLLGSCIFC